VENAAARGKQLFEGAQLIAQKAADQGSLSDNKISRIADVRGLGLMIGSEFVTAEGVPDSLAAQRAQKAAEDRGLLLLICGPQGNVVRMIPPLVITKEQIDQALEIWRDVVFS